MQEFYSRRIIQFSVNGSTISVSSSGGISRPYSFQLKLEDFVSLCTYLTVDRIDAITIFNGAIADDPSKKRDLIQLIDIAVKLDYRK